MNSQKNSLRPLFAPRSVAVIGASNDTNKFGGRPIKFMLQSGYQGDVFPVNPKADQVQGLKAYRDIAAVPEAVDLAILAIPAKLVVETARNCAKAGARALIIYASGFAEAGEEGRKGQIELTEIAREYGIRIVGPNCIGMINTTTRVVGTFGSFLDQGWPDKGGLSVVAQSGAVGGHVVVLAREMGMGIHTWMATGNECDVDVADCIHYCAEDPDCKVIFAYLEGMSSLTGMTNALDCAKRNGKPVIIIKAGSTEIGEKSVGSHTAALAGSDEVYDAVFQKYGAYRVQSIAEALDIAAAASAGFRPANNQIAIFSVSGGVGVMAADAAVLSGLDVAEMPQKVQDAVSRILPFIVGRNPVDTSAQVLADLPKLQECLAEVFENSDYESYLLFLSTVGLAEGTMSFFHEMLESLRKKYPDKLTAIVGEFREHDRRRMMQNSYLVYGDVNQAVNALAALTKISASLNSGENNTSSDRPALIEPSELAKGPISEKDALNILSKAGVPTVPNRLVTSKEDAVEAAKEFGYPVVLKVVSPDIQHKSDMGGVKLGLADADAVAAAFEEIMSNAARAAPDAKVEGVLVAPMLSGGIEMIAGSFLDPVFGPVVLVGMGGVLVEILKDTAVLPAPFSRKDAMNMIRSLRGYAILEGVRGNPPADIEAFAEAVSRLSVFVASNSEQIESVDVNPMLVLEHGNGAVAVDALFLKR